jgi:xanthine dehydrogenase accessory factor
MAAPQDGRQLVELIKLVSRGSALHPKYLDLLGARYRSSLLVAEAAAKLARSVRERCEQIHAPVGLDFGGDGPEAIALKEGSTLPYLQAHCALETA